MPVPTLMHRSVSYFLLNYGHTNRGRLYALRQRVRHVHVRIEDRATARASSIDGISRSCVDFLHVMPGAGNGNTGRVGVNFDNLFSVGKVTRDPRMNLDFTSQPRIEREMQLAGYDLHNLYAAWMMNLHRG